MSASSRATRFIDRSSRRCSTARPPPSPAPRRGRRELLVTGYLLLVPGRSQQVTSNKSQGTRPMQRGRRGSLRQEFGGSGEDSFVAVVVTKLTGALLFILLLTMVIMALIP